MVDVKTWMLEHMPYAAGIDTISAQFRIQVDWLAYHMPFSSSFVNTPGSGLVEMDQWCHDNLGYKAQGFDSGRWTRVYVTFFFRTETDHMLFLLKWRGEQ